MARPIKIKVVTLARLRKLDACPGALADFERTFGKQARITSHNLDRAEHVGLDADWLAQALRLIPSHADFTDDGRCVGCAADDKLKTPRRVRARRALLRAARG